MEMMEIVPVDEHYGGAEIPSQSERSRSSSESMEEVDVDDLDLFSPISADLIRCGDELAQRISVNVNPSDRSEMESDGIQTFGASAKNGKKKKLEKWKPEAELRKTVQAVSGLVDEYDASTLKKLLFKLTVYPTIAVFVIFIIPQCSLETSGHGCTPIPIINCIPSMVLVTCLVWSMTEWFNVNILKKRMREKYQPSEYAVIYALPCVGVLIIRPILQSVFNNQVVPMGIVFDLFTSFTFCAPPIVYYIFKHIRRRNLTQEQEKELYWVMFMGFVTCSMGPVNIVMYKGFVVGYVYILDSDLPKVVIYAYGSLGFKAIKEISLFIFKKIYNQFDETGYSLGQMWLFFLHGTEVISLQSLAKDPVEIFMLTFADLSGMGKNIVSMWMDDNIRNRAIAVSRGESLADLDREEIPDKIALQAMELVLVELVECLIPCLYLLHSVFVWITPNGENTHGIRRKPHAIETTSELSQFTKQCVIVIFIEIASVVLLQQFVQKVLSVHLLSGASEFISKYIDIISGMNVAVIALFWATKFTYFGCDVSLQFDWLE